jgi:hypothetical protein
LRGANSARPALGLITAGTPLTDRHTPGTVGIDLLPAFVAGLATLDYGCAVLIDRNDLPKHLFRIPDLDLSYDLCAEPLAAHGSGSGRAARVPVALSKVWRIWSTARAC